MKKLKDTHMLDIATYPNSTKLPSFHYEIQIMTKIRSEQTSFFDTPFYQGYLR